MKIFSNIEECISEVTNTFYEVKSDYKFGLAAPTMKPTSMGLLVNLSNNLIYLVGTTVCEDIRPEIDTYTPSNITIIYTLLLEVDKCQDGSVIIDVVYCEDNHLNFTTNNSAISASENDIAQLGGMSVSRLLKVILTADTVKEIVKLTES